MTALTREQVNEVMARHNDHWPADTVFSMAEVRNYASYLRRSANCATTCPEADAGALTAQADDLDALADRYEKEEPA